MGDLTVLQKKEIARGAEAMGAIVGRYAKRKSNQVISPLGTLSIWGKILAVLGAAALVAGVGLAVLDASHLAVERGQVAVVARETVNIRQAPTTGASIVDRAHMGDRFRVTGSRGEWTGVSSDDGKVVGWVSSSLMDRSSAKTLSIRYEMKGYVTFSLIALAVIFFALRMRKMPVEGQARSNETMLVNQQ
ncbi:MAG: SH3 domain-containing protein [bacterium]|nr:MAG: SH3 domain-containing protein [bacterium]